MASQQPAGLQLHFMFLSVELLGTVPVENRLGSKSLPRIEMNSPGIDEKIVDQCRGIDPARWFAKSAMAG
jgi:hypothetical protein